jgi:hypothetical protein
MPRTGRRYHARHDSRCAVDGSRAASPRKRDCEEELPLCRPCRAAQHRAGRAREGVPAAEQQAEGRGGSARWMQVE